MSEILQSFSQSFQTSGLGFVFGSLFIENLAIPFPTELAYLTAIGLIHTKIYSLSLMLTLLTAAHTLGSILAYVIGDRGRPWLERRFAKSEKFQDVKERIEAWFEEYGMLTVFGVRFIGYVRPWASFIAGFARFPFLPFVLLTILGSLIFNIIALYGSWVIILIWQRYPGLQAAIVVLIALSFLGGIYYKLHAHHPKPRSKKSLSDDQ